MAKAKAPVESTARNMRAAVYTRFGPPEVLGVRLVARPEPRPEEIRVRVVATTVTSACTMMRRGDTLLARAVLGPLRPRRRFHILGIEFAGVVDRVGDAVVQWQRGDRVFGFAGFNAGAYAEYLCVRGSASVAHIPGDLDFAEAASLVDAPTTALYFLSDLAGVTAGDRVLVIGASGSVGGAAVQVARHLGAEVTGVCSTANVDLVRSLGAHRVIDYSREDFTKGEHVYDVIFDAVSKSGFAACKGCLSPAGRYLPTVARARDYLLMAWTAVRGGKRVVCGMSVEKRDALGVVIELLANASLRPVIDRRYTLEGIAEAHRYVDSGRKRGNVVIEVSKE